MAADANSAGGVDPELGHWLLLGLLTAAVLGFFVYTLQPSLSWGDGARLQLEAISGESFFLSELAGRGVQFDPYPFGKLGVAAWDHPLYVMLGHSIVRLLPGLPETRLINLISALFGAGSIALLFQLAHRHTGSLLAASLGSLSVAVSHTFWFHSVTAEVYTLYLFLLLASLSCLDHFEQRGRFSSLILSAFFFGLGVANHLLAALLLPALLLYALLSRGHEGWGEIGGRQALGLGLAFLTGFFPYMVQLARMLSAFSFAEAVGPAVGSLFIQELLHSTPRVLLDGLVQYLLYSAYQFSPLALAFGIYGLLRGGGVSQELWRKVLAGYAVYTTFAILYRVTDQFAFFLTSHALSGLAISLGIASLVPDLASRRRRLVTAVLAAGIVGMPVFYAQVPAGLRSMGMSERDFDIPQVGTGVRDGLAYYLDPYQRGDASAYEFGDRFFQGAPANSLLIAQWYTDTDELFVMEFFSRVESRRADIEILGWPLEDPRAFRPELVLQVVAENVEQRPVFLASLSEDFYAASSLVRDYCIVAELNLYRLYPFNPADGRAQGLACLPSP